MNYTPAEYAKAIIGAVLAGLTALGTAIASAGVSPAEWVGVAIAVLATFGAVFGVGNRETAPGRQRRAGRHRGEHGASQLAVALIVIGVALVVLDGIAFAFSGAWVAGLLCLIGGIVLAATGR